MADDLGLRACVSAGFRAHMAQQDRWLWLNHEQDLRPLPNDTNRWPMIQVDATQVYPAHEKAEKDDSSASRSRGLSVGRMRPLSAPCP